jgi:hypothetical protein
MLVRKTPYWGPMLVKTDSRMIAAGRRRQESGRAARADIVVKS